MEDKEAQVLPRPSILNLYKEFGQRTTMHGLGRVSASRSRHRRCLWCVLVLSGFAVAVFHFTYLKDFGFASPWSAMNMAMRMASYVDNTSDHQLSDMLIKCLINKSPCSMANFTKVKSATHSSCYTFNPEDSKYMYTTRPGPENGLILELYIEHGEYFMFTPTAGIQVIVHEHDEKPFPEDEAVFAHPGVTTSIGLRKTVTRRLPKPYGNCINAQEVENLGLNRFATEMYNYTETACRKSCFQLSIYMKCSCCDPDLPCNKEDILKMAGGTPKPNQTIGICAEWDDFICMWRLEEEYLSEKSHCIKSCLPPCDQHTFKKVISTALWPSDPYLGCILYKINKTILANMTFTSTASLKDFIQTNFLRLEIYFDSLDYLEYVSYPKYDWSMLLGEIGGHLGLWLGCSLLTGMEFIELLIDTFLTWIIKYTA